MDNNSFIVKNDLSLEEKQPEVVPKLRAKEQELIHILEALEELKKIAGWSTLKTYVFDGLAERLEKELKAEAREEKPDTNRLSYLSGQLKWAEKYSDLDLFGEDVRAQLKNIRLNLHGTKQEK